MSSIIFDRMMRQIPHGEACETEEEVEEENFNFNNAEVHSKSYLVNLYKNLKNCNYFLNSIIASEQLNCVVISLFKNHRFSFGIKLFDSETVFERVHFTCEDDHIVDYIDNEELPPKLIDVIEMFDFKNIYYNGCIISEIRDYRQSSTDFFNSYFILLKPTSLSLYNDVKKIIGLTNKSFIWTNSSRLKLESKLIYLTSPKLCLDPNPCIGILSKKLSRKKLIFGNKSFLRLPRKRLKVMLCNDRLEHFKVLNFLKTKKISSNVPKIELNQPTESPTKTNFANVHFKEIEQLAKELHEPKELSQELVKTEDYLLEFLDIPSAFTKLTILHRPFDNIYFGHIVHSRNDDPKGPPSFYLGTEDMKRKYVDQFIDTISECGQRLVKITHKIGNQEPRVKRTLAVDRLLQQNSTTLHKIKSEQQKQHIPLQRPVNRGGETLVVNNQKPLMVNSIHNHNINKIRPENTSTNSNTEIPASTHTATSGATMAKKANNQIVIKHSNFKLINAANFTNMKEINDHHQMTTSSHNQTLQQPVVINVSTPTLQNGTHVPIRIPVPFSLLKSGHFALVSNSVNSTNNTISNNKSVTFQNNSQTNEDAAHPQQDFQQNQNSTVEFLNLKNHNHTSISNKNSENIPSTTTTTTHVPTNLNLIIQNTNGVYLAQPTQQM